MSILASVTHEKWKIQEDIAFRVLRFAILLSWQFVVCGFFFSDQIPFFGQKAVTWISFMRSESNSLIIMVRDVSSGGTDAESKIVLQDFVQHRFIRNSCFLGAFAKLRKTIIRFMSVSPSA